MPPQYVKPSVKRNKNDRAEAATEIQRRQGAPGRHLQGGRRLFAADAGPRRPGGAAVVAPVVALAGRPAGAAPSATAGRDEEEFADQSHRSAVIVSRPRLRARRT